MENNGFGVMQVDCMINNGSCDEHKMRRVKQWVWDWIMEETDKLLAQIK